MPAPYRSVFRPGLFDGKVVLVTGAGSGIGRCTAHELAALGATLALAGRKPDKLARVAAELTEAGATVHTFPCDIRVEEQVVALIQGVLEKCGRLDGLVNNAGGQFPSPLFAISQKGWETVVRTNLTGGFLVARESYNQWMEKHGGSIVNIVADFWNGMPGMGHSGAARAGMVNFTETAALEWAASHVRVNAVAPGWIASSGMDQYPPDFHDVIKSLADHVPLGRMGTESEVSAAIVFLLSEAAAFISGSTLRVDGAAPNVRAQWPREKPAPSPAYDAFPLASKPKILGGE